MSAVTSSRAVLDRSCEHAACRSTQSLDRDDERVARRFASLAAQPWDAPEAIFDRIDGVRRHVGRPMATRHPGAIRPIPFGFGSLGVGFSQNPKKFFCGFAGRFRSDSSADARLCAAIERCRINSRVVIARMQEMPNSQWFSAQEKFLRRSHRVREIDRSA
jgi:hypothetical protein